MTPPRKSDRLRRALRLPPRPKHYALEQTCSNELGAVASAAGLGAELARLDIELAFYRENCTCGAHKDARLIARAMR